VLPPDSTADDRFGAALALRDGQLLVGAPGDGLGRAYLFDTSTGALLRTLDEPANPATSTRFGSALAIAGDALVVGAPGTALLEPGSLYVFDRATGNHRLTVENPRPDRALGFGAAVAATDTTWFVGATTQWSPFFPAHAIVHVLDAADGGLRQLLRHPARFEPFQAFGAALVTRGNDELVVGSPVTTPGAPGAAYLFSTACPRCGPCERCAPALHACEAEPVCRPRVWLLGDSITHLYADDLAALVPEWDVEDFGFPFEISGEGADRLADLLRQVERVPHVALASFGTNDITFGAVTGLSQVVILDAVTTHMTSIRQRLVDAGVRPVMAAPISLPRSLWPVLFPDPGVAAYRAETVLGIRRALRALRPTATFYLRHLDDFPPDDPIHPDDGGQAMLAWRAHYALRRQLGRLGFH
jgi:lysophospholipase L1-like esterase